MWTAGFPIIIGILLLAAPVRAQQQGTAPGSSRLPAAVQAAIDDEIGGGGCPNPQYQKGFIATRDVNSDNIPDYIINYEHVRCGDSMSWYCGSAGCRVQVLASVPSGGYSLVWDENVRGIDFRTIRGRPAIVVDLHGTFCNRAGADPCAKTLFWDGRIFR